MKCRFIFKCAIFLNTLFLLAVSASAQLTTERIISFHSDITIHQDASLIVTETIKVYSNGQNIRRGIYRDFPLRYKDENGNRFIVGFSILSIKKDGRQEPYHTERISNGIRIYIGSSNIFLNPGEYTYEIAYETTRQIGFFPDHDELYWNVTGNGWTFPIEKASAIIYLPDNAKNNVLEMVGYSGGYGSNTTSEVKTSRTYDNQPQFSLNRMLRPYEGMTIAVSWPKGYIREPSALEKSKFFWQDNHHIFQSIFSIIFIVGYYLIIWYLVGKDPKKGTIIPLYYPPKEMSPASMRYLWKMNYDNKVLSSAVINLAVKGQIIIEESKDKNIFEKLIPNTYTLKKNLGSLKEPLSPEEDKLQLLLFTGGNEIELDNKNHSTIQAAINVLKASLNTRVQHIYFLTNQHFFVIGLVLSVGILFSMSTSFEDFPLWGILVAITTILTNLLFYHLLKAPTLKGRKILDQIEGFRMFLSVTEKDRLNFLNPPEKTPQLFEKYLPFALALDVEQKWAEQFTNVFAKLGREDYYPSWYSGSSWNNHRIHSFSRNLSTFTSTIAASATPPGSSSGSGGGGFSGGGGGGGGGGGW
ncbi:MAG: DUF2207 domain-containing protein [Candidatus Omnitrophica bacterium]|nr:DUF2207 domain-containing protein [Candidatus Omnitrophota bacterium]MCB9747354.1 DUF2207 domain-containing protein [Candidatus Omnitrophota bacterium]